MHKFLSNEIKKAGAYIPFKAELNEAEYFIDTLSFSDFILVNSIYKPKDYDKFGARGTVRRYEELINTKNVLVTYYETDGEYQQYYIYIANGGNEIYIRAEKVNEKGDLIRANKIRINYFDKDCDNIKSGESVYSLEKVVGNSEYTFSKVVMYYDHLQRYYRSETWNNEYNYDDLNHHKMVCELLDTVKPDDNIKQLRKKYGYKD